MVQKADDKLDLFATTLQQKLDGCPAILIGSGGSIPYGLPSMQSLADEIVSQLDSKYKAESCWKDFIAELSATNNLEVALDKVTLNDEIHNSIIATVWSAINIKDREAFIRFISDGTSPALTKILKKFVQRAGDTYIITTNYDRLVEYAIDFAQGKVETGFSGNYVKTFGNSASTATKRTVRLYKVHGSIDWFKHKTNQNVLAANFYNCADFSSQYAPLIVTPGNGKYKQTHHDPFRTVISEADRALRNASSYLCVGYGFNDEHIQPILIDENRNKNKSVVIVTKEVTPRMEELFLRTINNNCLIVSENVGGGTKVYYSKSDTEFFDDNYWCLDSFYKLWLE